ncbi:DNA alkylation repair protein [Paenibacillus sp. SAF-054]|uniref:DNA alkylation repair protein n=1 Tax=unclassified Paenibacillus TaxID=185978 RepID=UPI003F7EFF44
MDNTVREQLFMLAEEDYRKFSAALIPNISSVLGVRLPKLRKLAMTIAKGDWRAYLMQAGNDYFEEIMLQGMVIGYMKTDLDSKLKYVADFVPVIDNWSVCDSFCTGLKFAKDHQEKVWDFLQPYLRSRREYELRFGLVMLLSYYVNETYINRVLQTVDSIQHEGYYVKMAAAWLLSICYIKQPEITAKYLQTSSIDDFTFNKALQKMTESYQLDPETKRWIRSMKRKNVKS